MGQYPEILTGPTVRGQVVQLIPYLSNNPLQTTRVGKDKMDMKLGMRYILKLKNRQATYKRILRRTLMKTKPSIRLV